MDDEDTMTRLLTWLLAHARYVAKGSFGRVFACTVPLTAAGLDDGDARRRWTTMKDKLFRRLPQLDARAAASGHVTVAVKECRLSSRSQRWARSKRKAFANEINIATILDHNLGRVDQPFPVLLAHHVVAADTLVGADVEQPSCSTAEPDDDGADATSPKVIVVPVRSQRQPRRLKRDQRRRHLAALPSGSKQGTRSADGHQKQQQRRVGYIVMEYVDGRILYNHHPRHGARAFRRRRPSDVDVLTLLQRLLAFLAQLHDGLGLYLQDISSGNVMLRDNDWQQPVFIDFGLAGVARDERGAVVLGPLLAQEVERQPSLARDLDMLRTCGRDANTPGYISFQRWLLNAGYVRAVDWAKADVYALATVVYDCCYGRVPVVLTDVDKVAAARGAARAKAKPRKPESPIKTDVNLDFTYGTVYLCGTTPDTYQAARPDRYFEAVASRIRRYEAPTTLPTLRRLFDQALRPSESMRPTARALLLSC